MAQDGVQPLRIQKTNNSTSSIPRQSPKKMANALSEISPMGIRRNSPSFNQVTKKPIGNNESSPLDASPENKTLRSFWKTRESVSPNRFAGSENVPLQSQPSQVRRSSIERLQKASRVKNSNMFARASENGFDADSSIMSDRSFRSSVQLSGHAWVGKSGSQNGSAPTSPSKGHRRSDSTTKIPILSPSKSAPNPMSSTKPNFSPTKSSLSSSSRFAEANVFNPEAGTWSEDDDGDKAIPQGVLRHPKSVSFDIRPPQINEYEQITPDPSSVASGSREGSYDDEEYDMDLSFERGSSEDHDDSFDHSLEDTEKTPVVLPEDWRFMSPEIANTGLADTFEDPFEGREDSSRPSSRRGSSRGCDRPLSRSQSVTSDGEPRPLPPLPTSEVCRNNDRHDSEQPTAAAADSEPHGGYRAPSAPRPPSISKADVLKMQDQSMPLEERLRRLSLQKQHGLRDHVDGDTEQDGDEPTITMENDMKAHTQNTADLHTTGENNGASQSSQGSSLRHMKSQLFEQGEIDKYANLDPDVPIPSRETSSNYEDEQEVIAMKQEHPTKQVADMYRVQDVQSNSQQSSPFEEDFGREESVIRHDIPIYEDSEIMQDAEGHTAQAEQTTPTGRISPSLPREAISDENAPLIGLHSEHLEDNGGVNERKMSLPEFSDFSMRDSFGFGLESYMTPTPPKDGNKAQENTKIESPPQDADATLAEGDISELEQPPHVFDASVEGVGTPDSVIYNPQPEEVSPITPEDEEDVVPQPKATIKAPGSKLRTRTSSTTAELEAMRDDDIHTSSEMPPAIPDEFRIEKDSAESIGSEELAKQGKHAKQPNRRQSNRIKLDVPLDATNDDMGFGIDKEFDRLLEAQKVESYPFSTSFHTSISKSHEDNENVTYDERGNNTETQANVFTRRQRGYLMRQNTKVVVATNRNFSNEKESIPAVPAPAVAASAASIAPERETRSAGNSPRKPSGPTVTTEPWNGKMRRHSTRKSMITPEKPTSPTRQSIGGAQISALDGLEEDQQSFLEPEAGSERGRFFVKVTGVKNLDLPLPRNERTYFQLTLDNGLHCVTTAWLELGRNAQIGQEFELTVFDELDFSLTLQTKLERPTSQGSGVSQASSLESPKKKENKQSAFSRLLASPKKRREAERRQQEEQAELARQKQREAEAQRASMQPSAWDLLHNLVGPDGSFARSVVSLEDYEEKAFGRPITTEVPCFNNWAAEESFSSTKSKHGGVQRKPPYKIGNLSLQLLYIPKPKGVKDEDMPQSMSACVKQLKEAEANATRQFEGHLSQQGGDCPYWRRRFFKLNGSVLTAYHEATRQRRANIRLAKATKLIDDRSALTQTEISSKGNKGRRRSAFATDTEGYMFVEEGFRICFANGDTIDFYADTRQQKEEWMDNLSHVIGKDFSADKPTWTAAVLACERAKETKGPALKPASGTARSPPKSQPKPQKQSPLKSNPPSPTKQSRPLSNYGMPPPPVDKSPRHSLQASPHKAKASGRPAPESTSRTGASTGGVKRKAVRSMIF